MELQQAYIASLLRPRERGAHKGNFGHALLVAGSYGKMGAAVLAAGACLRGGAGLLTVHAPRCGYTVLQTAVPEAMFAADPHENEVTHVTTGEKYAAIGVGPGLGTSAATQQAVHQLLLETRRPMVIDADALNILGMHSDWMNDLPAGSILTPHPKEFERIAGKWNSDEERLSLQRGLSEKYKVIILVKGAGTCITAPGGERFVNTTGNPGMATGGSGDVLTGLITALLAQGYEPLQAAAIGVFVHGRAGDLAAAEKGETGMIAGDLRDHLPIAFRSLLTPGN